MITKPQPDHDPFHRRDTQECAITVPGHIRDKPPFDCAPHHIGRRVDLHERIHPDGGDEQPDSDYERGDLASDDVDCQPKHLSSISI
jgi:hypothetical protein